MNRQLATRLAAPAAFLAGITIAVLLVRAGLSDGETTTAAQTSVATTTAATTASTQTATAPKPVFVEVESGGTLDQIALDNDTTVEQLLQLNPGLDPTGAPGRAAHTREVALSDRWDARSPPSPPRSSPSLRRAPGHHPRSRRRRTSWKTAPPVRCSRAGMPNARVPIASITKLMTVLVALERADVDERSRRRPRRQRDRRVDDQPARGRAHLGRRSRRGRARPERQRRCVGARGVRRQGRRERVRPADEREGACPRATRDALRPPGRSRCGRPRLQRARRHAARPLGDAERDDPLDRRRPNGDDRRRPAAPHVERPPRLVSRRDRRQDRPHGRGRVVAGGRRPRDGVRALRDLAREPDPRTAEHRPCRAAALGPLPLRAGRRRRRDPHVCARRRRFRPRTGRAGRAALDHPLHARRPHAPRTDRRRDGGGAPGSPRAAPGRGARLRRGAGSWRARRSSPSARSPSPDSPSAHRGTRSRTVSNLWP